MSNVLLKSEVNQYSDRRPSPRFPYRYPPHSNYSDGSNPSRVPLYMKLAGEANHGTDNKSQRDLVHYYVHLVEDLPKAYKHLQDMGRIHATLAPALGHCEVMEIPLGGVGYVAGSEYDSPLLTNWDQCDAEAFGVLSMAVLDLVKAMSNTQKEPRTSHLLFSRLTIDL